LSTSVNTPTKLASSLCTGMAVNNRMGKVLWRKSLAKTAVNSGAGGQPIYSNSDNSKVNETVAGARNTQYSESDAPVLAIGNGQPATGCSRWTASLLTHSVAST
jgi:hypothetical protein